MKKSKQNLLKLLLISIILFSCSEDNAINDNELIKKENGSLELWYRSTRCRICNIVH
jgi:thioredoxin-related protein